MRSAASTNRCICAVAGKGIPTARSLSKPRTATTPIRTGSARMKFAHVSDIDRLLEEQTASWPLLARGMEGLKQAQTRAVDVDGYTVLVRHLPHRITSTTAKVDRASVEKRACFLCASNMPPEQKGLEFN